MLEKSFLRLDMLDMIEPILRWLVAPLLAFVWLLHTRVNKHDTEIAVLKSKYEADKTSHDREMKEMKETIKAIFQKLDNIEQALRK